MGSSEPTVVSAHRQDQSTVVCRGDRDLVRPALGLGNGRQVTVGAIPHCLTALPEFGIVTGDKANSVPTVIAVRCTGRCEVGDLELDICILARIDIGCRRQGQEGCDCGVLHLPEGF